MGARWVVAVGALVAAILRRGVAAWWRYGVVAAFRVRARVVWLRVGARVVGVGNKGGGVGWRRVGGCDPAVALWCGCVGWGRGVWVGAWGGWWVVVGVGWVFVVGFGLVWLVVGCGGCWG